MICDGEGVDIRTFVERTDKPFHVRTRDEDGFTIMMPRLLGNVLDAIYNILKFSVASESSTMASVLSKESSTDVDYIQTLIEESKK